MSELLYNGIPIPDRWPPEDLDPSSRKPAKVPYLESPPDIIPIDVGRQLFVDDFLISESTLERVYHLADAYEDNPVLKPQTDLEMNGGYRPGAVPFSDGVFYDPEDQLFKMWYQAGWYDNTAYATSQDGINWDRPELDVVKGTNCVLPPRPDQIRDGVSIWLDHDTKNPEERFKMSLFARTEEIANRKLKVDSANRVISGKISMMRLNASLADIANDPSRSKGYKEGIRLFTSPDGIHWNEREQAPHGGDNTTFFYNPFRKKWVFSIRNSRNTKRQRDYYEHSNFLEGCKWPEGQSTFWAGADEFDLPDSEIGEETQLYKIDAVGYESIMLGLVLIHRGPDNDTCHKQGIPKITELTVAFSRDGFHWYRPDRRSFIGATRRIGDWNRAYVHSAGGVCLVVGEKLFFYHAGWSGESPVLGGDMYADASTGISFLRRDGFASMNAGGSTKSLTTRKVLFRGSHLFVNADTKKGELRAEIQNENGQPFDGFSLNDCSPVSVDETLHMVRWGNSDDLSAFAGKPTRIKFSVAGGSLYSFWISPERSGASFGYVAAGGPGYSGPIDIEGLEAL